MSLYPDSLRGIYTTTEYHEEVYQVPLLLVDSYMRGLLQIALLFGARISVSVVISAILFMVAKTYNSVLFVLYQVNFALLVIHSGLFIYSLEGPTQSISSMLLSDADFSTSFMRNCSSAASIFTILIIYSLLATLVFQIHTAFSDTVRRTRWLVVATTIIICFPCAFIWSWYGVSGAIGAVDYSYNVEANAWVVKGAWTSFAVTISACSMILCAKLWVSSRHRARLGVEKFDPIKIILVMTFQNSVVPAVLAIVNASGAKTSYGFGSIPVLLTAAMLPIGYIWAQHRQLVLAAAGGSQDMGIPTKTYGTRIVDTLLRRKRGFDATSLPYANSASSSPINATFEKTVQHGAASVRSAISDDY